MQSGLRREVERALTEHLGEEVQVSSRRSLGGGCVNNAERLDTNAGPFFVKSNPTPLPGLFEREAEGLRALSSVGSLTVPEPIHASSGGVDFPPFLLMVYIESNRERCKDFFGEFGRRLAQLHRNGTAPRYGFENDNYCGSTSQPNGWTEDWVEFWREHRLGHQLRLAERNGFAGELQTLGARLMERLPELIAEPAEPPTLLHGDLWSGNFMVDSKGDPALIDPATYYGRREADLAMTMLFGGFDSRFLVAYEEEWPLAPGSEERLEVYKLYHLLNHLNLFGGGYRKSCIEVMERFVG